MKRPLKFLLQHVPTEVNGQVERDDWYALSIKGEGEDRWIINGSKKDLQELSAQLQQITK